MHVICELPEDWLDVQLREELNLHTAADRLNHRKVQDLPAMQGNAFVGSDSSRLCIESSMCHSEVSEVRTIAF